VSLQCSVFFIFRAGDLIFGMAIFLLFHPKDHLKHFKSISARILVRKIALLTYFFTDFLHEKGATFLHGKSATLLTDKSATPLSRLYALFTRRKV
jgi:hypothetical protein